jgi:hypothetical protein
MWMTNRLSLIKRTLLFTFFVISSISCALIIVNDLNWNRIEEPKKAGTWATLDLINPVGINGSRFPFDFVIPIQGRLYNRIPPESGKGGYRVVIEIDSVLHPSFDDVTDSNGYFQIDYVVSSTLNVFSPHKLEVKVYSPTPPGDVEYRTHYLININCDSFFEINDPSTPKIVGEVFEIDGFLKYQNGTGINNHLINYYWYYNTAIISSGTSSTNTEGKISSISIPDVGSSQLTLKFNYSNNPYVSYSEGIMSNTKLFTGINCLWNLPSIIRELGDLRIFGQIVSSTNPSLEICNRVVLIYYNNSYVGSNSTDSAGIFSYTHALPAGIGLASLRLEIENSIGKNVSVVHYIDVQQAQLTVPSNPNTPPFLTFFSIFLPILAGIIIGLVGYGIYYYKKQDKISRIVHLPLEEKIKNLKILKETGRLEESLSYLFNAIYMELVNAKFGRSRKNNETIRDFAIVSVRQLNLAPTAIYPFIQKVEEIIYAKPFLISEKDFYHAIELFSPVYFELTGYNFVLNF